jgi:rRNA processing protein Gar1
VGTVHAVTPSGLLTLRAHGPDPVPEGTRVRDARGVVRGTVVRVFGPVRRPFLSVRPQRTPSPSEGVALLGAPILRE